MDRSAGRRLRDPGVGRLGKQGVELKFAPFLLPRRLHVESIRPTEAVTHPPFFAHEIGFNLIFY